LATFALFSCQKELNFDTPPGGGGTGGGGSSSNCKDCLYQPFCVASRWTFIDSNLQAGSATLTKDTVYSRTDTSIGGVVYQKIVNASPTPAYYNCDNGVLTLKTFNAPTAGGQVIPVFTTTLLKANAAVGATWADTLIYSISGVTQKVRYAYTIISKGGTRTVLGRSYTDVIDVEQIASNFDIPLIGTLDQTRTHYYFARGIGMIESSTYNLFFGQDVSSRLLQEYFIP
jgi:hypothetical protein